MQQGNYLSYSVPQILHHCQRKCKKRLSWNTAENPNVLFAISGKSETLAGKVLWHQIDQKMKDMTLHTQAQSRNLQMMINYMNFLQLKDK